MIVDTSALIAIIKQEPEAADIAAALSRANSVSLSAASYVEAGIIADRMSDPVIARKLDDLLRIHDMEIVEVTASQANRARQAYRDFGKGGGHPAQLNFGDCFSYALAAERHEPLLFKGDDFGHTDLTSALS
ncbi:type II toxin-antitoxin system VapC family toxin [Arthrobacter monumenti]